MAAIMAEVLGKPIRCQRVSFKMYKAGFVERGMSDAKAQGMTDMARAKNEGLDNTEPHRTAHAREHDTDQFPAVVRRDTEAGGARLIEVPAVQSRQGVTVPPLLVTQADQVVE
jgi:hypothetical protein